MAIRSYIGIIVENRIEVVYCHRDGDIQGVGKILYQNYDFNKIMELLERGSIISLTEKIDDVKFYDDDTENIFFNSLAELELKIDAFIEYVYLYDTKNKKWICYKNHEKFEIIDLESKLEKIKKDK